MDGNLSLVCCMRACTCLLMQANSAIPHPNTGAVKAGAAPPPAGTAPAASGDAIQFGSFPQDSSDQGAKKQQQSKESTNSRVSVLELFPSLSQSTLLMTACSFLWFITRKSRQGRHTHTHTHRHTHTRTDTHTHTHTHKHTHIHTHTHIG